MRKIILLVAALSLLQGMTAFAQDDPTVMTINGQPVSRSEFEYSYNKNNAEGVIDKKSVDEYVDLFINYKLKVQAALDAHLDTLSSYKKEFASYRDQQIRPSIITNDDVEHEARRIYEDTKARVDSAGGLWRTAHILVLLRQKSTEAQQAAAKARIDSIYGVLQHGADFAEVARKCSDDKGTARNGGQLPWVEKGQLLKEYEDVAYALKPGEVSKPFLSPAGYHIVKMVDHRMFFPYDTLHKEILTFIEQRGLREQIINHKLDSLAKAASPQTTPAKLLEQKAEEMSTQDPNLKNLIREYHDGLLLYEISNRTVWDKAANDKVGLAKYFKKNKKKYRWDEPRFKGIAYRTRNVADVKAVADCVKGVPFDQWAEKLRSTFNNDSILRIRVEKGIFKKGDNAIVDHDVFKKDTLAKEIKDFPNVATYGKLIKAPEDYEDVRGLVVADYQDQMEKQWVAELRKKYRVVVNKDVLATVNKH